MPLSLPTASVGYNKLRRIPEEIGKCIMLEKIIAHDNALVEVMCT